MTRQPATGGRGTPVMLGCTLLSMPSADEIPAALTLEEWRIVQMALDTQFYEDEHAKPGGVIPQGRRARADQTESRLALLAAIDHKIAAATGLSPMLS
jgi:hypothetical protein